MMRGLCLLFPRQVTCGQAAEPGQADGQGALRHCRPAQRRLHSVLMADVTEILNALAQGDPAAAEQLLPLVYDELRQLAAQKLAHEKPGRTLQATALVHEAYLRLVGPAHELHWNSRGHFFAGEGQGPSLITKPII
jgi:hypothetical protein